MPCSTAWFAEAGAAEPNDPTAMALATADAGGRPSVADGTAEGPRRARLRLLHQQPEAARARSSPPIRARRCCSTGSRCAARCGSKGRSQPVSDAEADAYFATRSRDSQLGAWASDQSRPLELPRGVRGALRGDSRRTMRAARCRGLSHWWGYRLVPERIEFWTDRPHRLHERRLFTLGADEQLDRGPALPMSDERAPR